jgi:hypothetical protein
MTVKGMQLRRQAEELVDRGKDLMAKQKELLSAALEAGRLAYQEEKSKPR